MLPPLATTLLTNIFLGFFDKDEPVRIGTPEPGSRPEHAVYKSHDLETYKRDDLYIIGVERPIVEVQQSMSALNHPRAVIEGATGSIPAIYHNKPNVLIFQYNTLLYKGPYTPDAPLSLKEVIAFVSDRLSQKLNIVVSEDQQQSAVKRVNDMTAAYKEIKHKPFSYWDPFYHIHGQHRSSD